MLGGLADSVPAQFDKDLFVVLQELDSKVIDVIARSKRGGTYDAGLILNSRPQMVAALRSSGYNEVVENYLAEYEKVPGLVAEAFKARKLPAPKFTTASFETFKQLATADLENFNIRGAKAMDDLRLGLHRQSLSSQPFSAIVKSIKAATVGTAKNGSPLANYAKTYANTAFQSFGGEAARVAGESLGAEKWEVVGVLDSVTRQECADALANPIRTTAEWQAVGYFGGAPGGWNCRHILYPVLDD